METLSSKFLRLFFGPVTLKRCLLSSLFCNWSTKISKILSWVEINSDCPTDGERGIKNFMSKKDLRLEHAKHRCNLTPPLRATLSRTSPAPPFSFLLHSVSVWWEQFFKLSLWTSTWQNQLINESNILFIIKKNRRQFYFLINEGFHQWHNKNLERILFKQSFSLFRVFESFIRQVIVLFSFNTFRSAHSTIFKRRSNQTHMKTIMPSFNAVIRQENRLSWKPIPHRDTKPTVSSHCSPRTKFSLPKKWIYYNKKKQWNCEYFWSPSARLLIRTNSSVMEQKAMPTNFSFWRPTEITFNFQLEVL